LNKGRVGRVPLIAPGLTLGNSPGMTRLRSSVRMVIKVPRIPEAPPKPARRKIILKRNIIATTTKTEAWEMMLRSHAPRPTPEPLVGKRPKRIIQGAAIM